MTMKTVKHEENEAVRAKILAAALPLIPFDGWGHTTLDEAAKESDVTPELAKSVFPRGGVDLALAFHRQGDTQLREAMGAQDLSSLRYSERVAEAIWMRIELIGSHKEAVRRATALFALPNHASDGAKAIWETADTIWNALGDTSEDVNWYTKRMTLSAVYSSVLLYWLGDQSEGHSQTRAFITRRIDNVMAFEKTKARFRESPLGKAFSNGPGRLLQNIKAPKRRDDLPGYLR